MTSRCTGAFGATSSMATRPSSRPTTVAGRSPLTIRQKTQSSSGSEDPLLRDGHAAHLDELADPALHDPGRVVVREAAARPVDQHHIVATDLAAPPTETGFPRERA